MIKNKSTLLNFAKAKLGQGTLISVIVVALAVIAVLAGSAGAANFNWTASSIVTINSNNYTIASGSAADTFIVYPTKLTVNIPASSTFTLTSASGYTFTLSDTTGTTQICDGVTNQLVVTGAGLTQDITPTGSTCVVASSQPSNGGGGDSTPPGDVTNITATVSLGKVVLTWTKPTNSDFASQKIYRSTVSGTRGSLIASGITGSTYTDTSVTNGATYYYTIHAIDNSGNENTSAVQISAVPGIPSASPTPTPAPITSPSPTVSPSPAIPVSSSVAALYRADGDSRVYVVKDGKKTWIKSAEEFNSKGYKWADIIVTTPAAVAAYPDAAISADAILYRAEGDSKVYVVKDNIKQWIKSAEEFNSKGYKWADIVVTTPAAVAAYSDGIISGETVVVKVKIINTSTLRVRKLGTTASAVLASVKRNEVFIVLEEKSGWYKIQTSKGVVGWISGSYAVKQ